MKHIWAEDLSKLNKVELTKLNKDGLDILADLPGYVEVTDLKTVAAEDLDLLKWAGVYRQRPRQSERFVLRVKVPSGIINSTQARTLAGIAREYGHGIIDLTTRQAIQYRWLALQDLPKVMERLAEAGLSTVEACGDCPRTIVGNPLAGIDPDEVLDTRGIVQEVYDYFQANREFSNLPRKFKISVSANQYNVAHAEINDVSFVPARKEIEGSWVYGFHVLVGGGLSVKPYMAQKLDIFAYPEEVLKVAIGVAGIYRDYGYRERRNHARLKFLVADWGVAKFCEELAKITGPLQACGEDLIIGWNPGYFYGVHPQKQPGLNYVGLAVPLGRLNPDQMDELARLAEKHGDGSLRVYNSKNFVLANIPDVNLSGLLSEKLLRELKPFQDSILDTIVPCTGSEFCNLATVETKERSRIISEYLDQRLKLETPIRIHVNGCPNACGHLQIADIGLQGTVMRINGQMEEAFELMLGGRLGPGAAFGTKLTGRIPATRVAEALEYLLIFYQNTKEEGEVFAEFVMRVGCRAFQIQLDKFLVAFSA